MDPTPDQPPESDALAQAQAALQARRDAILVGMLPDVAFDGWTDASLRRGAQAADMPEQEAKAAFPGGPVEAIRHFSDWADRGMLDELAKHDLSTMKVRDRITLAVRCRLELLTPHREAVRRASAMLSLPGNVGMGPRLMAATVDAAWRAAGDRSTDYNFYTKRLLLAGVVASTMLYWLDDRSDALADTWAFLDRRIANVMTIGKSIGTATSRLDKFSPLLNHLPSPARLARHLRQAMASR